VEDLGGTSLVGRPLAHYQISSGIGAGGMGEVYRATDTKLARDIALKVLPPEMASDPGRLTRFQRASRFWISGWRTMSAPRLQTTQP
jgi:serine/threonine protein kinase